MIIEAVSALCQTVVSCLQGAETAAQSGDLADSKVRDSITSVLGHARDATTALSAALCKRQ